MNITFEGFVSLRELLEEMGYSEMGAYNTIASYMQGHEWAIEKITYLQNRSA